MAPENIASRPESASSFPGGRGPVEDEGYDIRIARDGVWWHEGAPIRRLALVRLFAGVLRRDEAGDYWLVTPAERGRIRVEDAPFVAVEMRAEGAGEDQVLRFRTNVDDWATAGPDHPIRVAADPETGEPSPYVLVRNGLEARLARPVYYELAERAVPRDADGEGTVYGVWSKGAFFPIGSAA